MKPLTEDDGRIEGVPFREFFLKKDVLLAVELLKNKIRGEINNPYTLEPKVHLGICLKWVDECFDIQEQENEKEAKQ